VLPLPQTQAHVNICPLLGSVLHRGKLFILFPYVEYTLEDVLLQCDGSCTGRGLPRNVVLPLAKQLLCAVAHCHAHGVMHRNIKPKHVLLRLRASPASPAPASPPSWPVTSTPRRSTGAGETTADWPEIFAGLEGATLQLADFALMRAVTTPGKCLTPDVSDALSIPHVLCLIAPHLDCEQMVSLWYRPPEMLLGVRNYSEAADIWSVGCVFAEMLRGTPLFTGASQIEQLFLIFEALGTPTEDSWPGVTAAPFFFTRSFPQWQGRKASLTAAVPTAATADLELLARCLCCCPDLRATATQLLTHSIWDRVCTSSVEVEQAETCGGQQLSAQQAGAREHGEDSLLTRLNWATSVIPPAELRRRAADAKRALRWQQLGTMREAEARCRAREERDAEAAVLQEIRRTPWYQVVVKALVCIHSAKGTDSGGRSLDRAVVLLDAYCVSEAEVLLNDCERSEQSCGEVISPKESLRDVKAPTQESSCEDEDNTDFCGRAPTESTIHHDESAQAPDRADEKEALLRTLEVTSTAWATVVVAGVACVQLASKLEVVCYLDTTEIKSLAAAVAATLEGSCGASEVNATLLLALTEMGAVDGDAVLVAEETVLCANSFDFGGPTARGFASLYAEEAYLLLRLALAAGRCQSKGGLHGGFGKVHDLHIESQSMLSLLAGWDLQTRNRLHREGAGPQSLPLPPWLPFLYSLNDLTITTALLSPDSADFAPSQLAAATVLLTMQVLAEISSQHGDAASNSGTGEGAPLCEDQGTRDVASESSRVTEGSCPRAVQLRGVLTAALQTWSGYTEGELREAAAALWPLLHRSVRNKEKQTLPVGLVTPVGCITPPRWSLTELLAPLNLLGECEEVTRVQTGQSDVLAGTAATQKW
jgi:serine/threonine protein kinase